MPGFASMTIKVKSVQIEQSRTRVITARVLRRSQTKASEETSSNDEPRE